MTALRDAISGMDSHWPSFITSYSTAAFAPSLPFLVGGPSTRGVLDFSGKVSIRQPSSAKLLHSWLMIVVRVNNAQSDVVHGLICVELGAKFHFVLDVGGPSSWRVYSPGPWR